MDDKLKKQLARQLMRQAAEEAARQQQDPAAYKDFNAAELFCPKCKQAMPVKEKMLLVLPSGELFDYLCSKCGTSLGTRKT